MTKTNSIRKFAAITFSLVLAITLTSCSLAGYGNDANPKTSQYIFDQFKDGKYLDPFQTGSPDIGASMEAMIQLSGVGYNKDKQAKAIEWLTNNTSLLTSTGQRAEYIFTAHALEFESDESVAPVLEEVISAIPANTVIAETNNFSYSWVILGLAAAGEKELANRVALKLSTLGEIDGSYKYVANDTSGQATADVTAFSILSIKATEGFGSTEDEAAKTIAVEKAKTWLKTNAQSNDHWLGFGDIDISGTAYAAMALGALGEKTDLYVKWLQSRMNTKNGGLITPWSDPEADAFGTLQSILALSKVDFIDILKHASK